MEKEILSESEILEILKNKLVKGSSVNSLCEELNISDYDLIKTAVDNFDDKNVVEKRFTRIAGFTQKGSNKIQKARKNLSWNLYLHQIHLEEKKFWPI